MSKSEDLGPNKPEEFPRPAATADNENQQTPDTAEHGVPGILRRWRREDLLKRGALACRGCALFLSLLSFIITASNKHGGDWKNFDQYEEYRYLLAIAIFSTVYCGVQVLRHVHELSTGKQLLSLRRSAILDFAGDQVMAYLLISSASAAIPLTNRMREGSDNMFTDSSATGIGIQFFAFLALALSALISGFKLSNQTYI